MSWALIRCTALVLVKKGVNPLTRTSFIITEDLTPTISLEDYCADWAVNPPDAQVKWMIIKRVATMVRKMHAGELTIATVIFATFFCIYLSLVAKRI